MGWFKAHFMNACLHPFALRCVGYVAEPEDDWDEERKLHEDEGDGCCSAGWWEPCCEGNEEPRNEL